MNKRKVLTVCIASAISSMATAQQAPDIEEISVIGQFVPDEKRSTDQISNVVGEEQFTRAGDANIADSLKRGAWYEVYNGEDRPVRRLKLAVVLEDTAELIFVDRKGNTVIEKDAAEFAVELEDKRSSMIADHSTFDNALGNVINALAA